MTAITIQELNQNRKLLHSIPEQKKIGNTFFLFCIKEWNTKIRNLLFISSFKKLPVVYLQNDENSIFDVHTPIDIKLLNRLRVNFSHLHKHKFRHNFRDTVNPFRLCNVDTETISHYLLGCPLFAKTLLNHCDDDIVNIFLYGSSKYSFSTNNKILSLIVEFLESTKHFDKRLF